MEAQWLLRFCTWGVSGMKSSRDLSWGNYLSGCITLSLQSLPSTFLIWSTWELLYDFYFSPSFPYVGDVCRTNPDQVEMRKYREPENSWGLILGGLVMIAIFGFLTWLQIQRINEDSYWIIFRIWFIPVPVIILSGIGTLAGMVLFFRGISAGLASLFRK